MKDYTNEEVYQTAFKQGYKAGKEKGREDERKEILDFINKEWDRLTFDLHIRGCGIGHEKSNQICFNFRESVREELIKEITARNSQVNPSSNNCNRESQRASNGSDNNIKEREG
jgi:hypothetical protein